LINLFEKVQVEKNENYYLETFSSWVEKNSFFVFVFSTF